MTYLSCSRLSQSCRVLTVLGASLLANSAIQAATVIQHSGSTDPTTEGWAAAGVNLNNLVVGPVDDSGTPAWFVDDDIAAFGNGSTYTYTFVPTAVQNAAASSLGWTLSTRLRVVDLEDARDFSVFLEYSGNTPGAAVRFPLAWGTDEFGGAIVGINVGAGSSEFAVGSGGYHTYDLIYDPVAGSADLFVDGVERISNSTGVVNGSNLNRVIWGSASSGTMGQGNYASVSFSVNDVVPEPSSLAVAATSIVSLFALRKRS